MDMRADKAASSARRWRLWGFYGLAVLFLLMGMGTLLALLGGVVHMGWDRLNWDFLTGIPSRHPERAGIHPALIGSLYVVGLTAVISIPIGIAAALFFEEYMPQNKLSGFLEVNLANLAGTPSIIYGLLGLELFVRTMRLGKSLIAGALTLSLLILPIIIISARESIRRVPMSIREAALALGATRWQMIQHHVLPLSLPGILTGVILAVSRAIGETAPLIMIGALTYVTFVPDSLKAPFTALPIQIFNWISRPQKGFHVAAAAAIIVLLVVTFLLNAIAFFLRHHYEKKSGLKQL